ncbi:MAG: hypothetical protein FWD92_02935 [Methanomassiliicoccaceae archaeon]|nr:hypothetical protein [Methanomassiliicoccaceae archaeon]
MLEPKELKDTLQRNGLIQDDLFELGTSKGSTLMAIPLTVLSIAILAPPDASSTVSVFAFTLMDGKLIITPVGKNVAVIGDAVSIGKEDVKEMRLRRSTLGDCILAIRYNDGKQKEYYVGSYKEGYENIKKIVENFNSGVPSCSSSEEYQACK